jgi:hypothetical protein
MLTLDHHGRRIAAATILRAHSDDELARILVSCTPSVADDCRAFIARYGRPEPFSKHDKAAFTVKRAHPGAAYVF